MTAALKIEFVSSHLISADVQKNIDDLARAAFAANVKNDDPEFKSIEWSGSQIETMALGFIDGELVTLLGLLQREILVGEQSLWVVGVGGVATHPNWQKRGLASGLLKAVEAYMCEKMGASFGLLVCAEERRPFYRQAGWQVVADHLFFWQQGQRRVLKTPVMVLPLADASWPSGEIDLRKSPW
jgi:predicted acetyltransferase